jgi:hypothetical protein
VERERERENRSEGRGGVGEVRGGGEKWKRGGVE